MSDPNGLPSLRAFVDLLDSAKYSVHPAGPERKMPDEGAFKEMKTHLLRLYAGTEARHSFMDEVGAVWDCIPIEEQPALKGTGQRIARAPDLPPIEEIKGAKSEREDIPIQSPLGRDKKDRHGNTMYCPEGTIPMRRVTLDDLTRFPDLRSYLRKSPDGGAPPPQATKVIAPQPMAVAATHRWAHAYQTVNAGGGHSFLNLWNPAIGANQIFSLSQHWYTAGSGTGLQTVECGWQVYPGRLGDTKTHLFTYWTADGYNTTGCYDLTCPAFVQLSSTFAPGMVLGPISTPGGPQYSVELSVWHTGGKWYLYFQGQSGSNAIGYYPDTLFKGGALTKNATSIDYGGETVGTTSFPPMGSGQFANQGWTRAAYQRAIGYWTPAGGAMNNANLTAVASWPSCYTAQVQMFGAPWSETLWFGGPGGSC